MSVQITNGSLNLIDSGVFIANANEPIVLTLRIGTEFIKLDLKFVNNDKENEHKKETNILDDTTLQIIFTNYTNTLGTFTTELWRIGFINNRKVYWSYAIYGLAGSFLKKIEYSFYLGEEVGNG